jgi:hypothetical protein
LVDYLAGTKGFEEIFLMLFCHGVDSIGLAGVECWRALLARAERRSECEVRLRESTRVHPSGDRVGKLGNREARP